MPSHRLIGQKRLTRRTDDGYEHIGPGEAFEPTEAELRAFGDRLEPVDEAADGDDAGEEGTGTEPPFDPTGHSVSEIEDALDDGDYDDDELAALLAAEQADDDPRTTAVDAIEAAR